MGRVFARLAVAVVAAIITTLGFVLIGRTMSAAGFYGGIAAAYLALWFAGWVSRLAHDRRRGLAQ